MLPVCISDTWWFKSKMFVNLWSHIGHLNLFIPSWTKFTCSFNSAFSTKLWSHKGQLNSPWSMEQLTGFFWSWTELMFTSWSKSKWSWRSHSEVNRFNRFLIRFSNNRCYHFGHFSYLFWITKSSWKLMFSLWSVW